MIVLKLLEDWISINLIVRLNNCSHKTKTKKEKKNEGKFGQNAASNFTNFLLGPLLADLLPPPKLRYCENPKQIG